MYKQGLTGWTTSTKFLVTLKSRPVEQTEDPNVSEHNYNHLIFDKDAKNTY